MARLNGALGTLTDREIESNAANGSLIVSGFRKDRVKQACYELSASDTYYDLASPDRPMKVSDGEKILLRPRQILVFIAEEKLALPANVLGRVLSKGQLFSLGIVPVNTYADPGFVGRLGIVLINASNDYLAIPVGTAIAKIEFVRLQGAVARPYSGQHGYETSMWPVPHELKLTAEEIEEDPRIDSVPDELSRAFGPDFAVLVRRVFYLERRLIIGAVIYLTSMLAIIALAFGREERLGIGLTVFLGIVSNFGFLILTYAVTNLKRGRRWKWWWRR